MIQSDTMPAKIHLGPAGNCLSAPDKGTLASLQQVKKLGLNAQEIEFVRFTYMTRKTAEEASVAALELGIELSVHGSYFVNFSSPDRKTVVASEKRILEAVDRAEAMGAGIVVFHPGYYGSLSPQEAAAKVREACEEMLEKMPSSKILLGLETTGKKSQYGSLEELVELCKHVKGCVPVVDFAHIYARQGGVIDYSEVFDALKQLNLKHLHAHFSGIAYSNKGERNHLTIDSKQPDFTPLAKEVLRRKLDITIISESPVLEADAVAMKKIFEKLGYKF